MPFHRNFTYYLAKKIPATCFVFLLFIAGCKKTGINEIDKLPSATQTGRNIFGCLVNGQAYIADNGCRLICTPAFRSYYNNSNGGVFSVTTELTFPIQSYDMYLGFDVSNCKTINTYPIGNTFNNLGVYFANYKEENSNCTTFSKNDSNIVRNGYLNVTRIDLVNGIISGTFEFTLSKMGCQTIIITNGRFDSRL